MKLKEKLFPAKNPALIKVYGRFDRSLEESVQKQMKAVFDRETRPDGLVLLINSRGGDTRALTTLINGFLKIGLPCMGFVENDALSCGAELLLSCQYRVATPFSRILFHSGEANIDIAKLLEPGVLVEILKNQRMAEDTYLERFCRITKQPMDITRAIYRADSSMPASRAVELGILHEITENVYPASSDDF